MRTGHGRFARPESTDIALAGLLGVLGLAAFIANPPGPAAAGLALLLVQAVAVLLRATAPAVMVVVVAAALIPSVAFVEASAGVPWVVAAFLVGLHGGGRLLTLAFSVGGAATVGLLLLLADPAVVGAWVRVAGSALAALVLLGYGAGRVRRAARTREGRRRDAAERTRTAAQLAAERKRIADDLGVVVFDELGRLAALAAGLRAAVAAGPAEPALAQLQQSARRVLAAMRRVLTVLRAAATDAPPEPGEVPRRWWEPRRPKPAGWALAVTVGVATVFVAAVAPPPTGAVEVDRAIALIDLPLDRPVLLAVVAVQVAATAWWRSAPVPALVVVTATSLVLHYADATNFVAEVGWMVLVYAAGSWAAPRVSSVAVASCSLAVVAEFVGPMAAPIPLAEAVLAFAWVVPVWVLGVLVRQARHRGARARDEAATGRIRTRLGDERHRIARELHDLVAHHASAVAVQASAARSEPASLPAAIGHVEESGRRIAEAVCGLAGLRPDLAPLVPLTPDGVEQLAGPARTAGLPVVVAVEGAAPPEPGEADLFAQRIVVEALTNVLRHAGPSPTHVTVRHEEDAVAVEIRDAGVVPGHRPVTVGSGLGVAGMRERAALLGGEASAGPGGRGWTVRAHLPRPRPGPARPTLTRW